MKLRTEKSATLALAMAATVAWAGPAVADTGSDNQSSLLHDDSDGAGSDKAVQVDPPTSVQMERLSSGVKVSWTPASGNTEIGGYNVYSGNDYIATVEGSATSWTDAGAVGDQTYMVTSFDVSQSHFSGPSAPAQDVTTPPEAQADASASNFESSGDKDKQPGLPGGHFASVQGPSMPSDVRATNSKVGVVLRWTPSTSSAGAIAGYNIYRNGDYVDTVNGQTQWSGPLASADDLFSVSSFDDGEPAQFSSTTEPVTIGGVPEYEEADFESEPDQTGYELDSGSVEEIAESIGPILVGGEPEKSEWDPRCEAAENDWRLFLDGQDGTCTYQPGGNGTGVTVYVVDTVVDIDHQAFDGVNVQPSVSSVNGFAGGTSQTRSRSHVPQASEFHSGDEPLVHVLDSQPIIDEPGGSVTPNIISPPLSSDSCGPSHGTKVAGLVASPERGVASGVTIVPVEAVFCYEVRYPDGTTGFEVSGTQTDLLASLDWIAEQNRGSGRRAIVNISLGIDDRENSRFANRIEALNAAGVLVISAAGNDGADACDYAPGNVVDHQLTVGSIDRPGQSSGFSNTGPCVDLYAAGGAFLANDVTGGWSYGTGTSASAPIVTGAAAIYWSQNPWLTPDQVIAHMKSGATTFEDAGAGCVDNVCLAAQILPDRRLG